MRIIKQTGTWLLLFGDEDWSYWIKNKKWVYANKKNFNFDFVNFVSFSEGNTSEYHNSTLVWEGKNSESDWAMAKGTDLTTSVEGGDKLKLKCLRVVVNSGLIQTCFDVKWFRLGGEWQGSRSLWAVIVLLVN